MLVSLIAAVADDRIIGSASGRIPWDLPRDRAHFRARTAGRWLLLGRRTYLEMTGWFEERTPLVLTTDTAFRTSHPAHRIAPSPTAAIALARGNGVEELLVCGGSRVYASTLPFADRILLTRIDLHPKIADPVHFPEILPPGQWSLRHAEAWPAEEGHPAARFEVLERVKK